MNNEMYEFVGCSAENPPIVIFDAIERAQKNTRKTWKQAASACITDNEPTGDVDLNDPLVQDHNRCQTTKKSLLQLLDPVMPNRRHNNYCTAIEHYLCNILTNKKPDTERKMEKFIYDISLLSDREKKKLLIHFWRSYKKNIPFSLFIETMKDLLSTSN